MSIYQQPYSDGHFKMKRGDSLELAYDFINDKGDPADLSKWEVRVSAQGKSSGNITDLPTEIIGSSVTVTISHAASTAMDAFSTFDVQFTESAGPGVVTPAGGIIQQSSEVTK